MTIRLSKLNGGIRVVNSFDVFSRLITFETVKIIFKMWMHFPEIERVWWRLQKEISVEGFIFSDQMILGVLQLKQTANWTIYN